MLWERKDSNRTKIRAAEETRKESKSIEENGK